MRVPPVPVVAVMPVFKITTTTITAIQRGETKLIRGNQNQPNTKKHSDVLGAQQWMYSCTKEQ